MAYKILTITIGWNDHNWPNYTKSVCYDTNNLKRDLSSEKSTYDFINQLLKYPYKITFDEFRNLSDSHKPNGFNHFCKNIKIIDDLNSGYFLPFDTTMPPISNIKYLMISFHELKFLK